MTVKVGLAGMGPRWIGALAGLAPAALIVGYYVVTGGEIEARLGVIVALAIVAGWLVGPLSSGPLRADLVAMVAYFVVGYLLSLANGAVISIWDDITGGLVSDPSAVIQSLAGRLLVGFAYLPVWAVFLMPVALVWMMTVQVIRGRVRPQSVAPRGSDESMPSSRHRAIRPRRIGLAAAAIIVGYGLFVAAVPLVREDQGPTTPWSIYRPIALFGLFAVPAVVAGIGAIRGVRPLLIAAGALCLLQAYIAFSGVTMGFVVPAIVLLWLGAAAPSSAEEPRPSRATLLAGVAIIGLTIAAWVSLFALTEERCWVASRASDGALSYAVVPVTNTMTLGPDQVAGGCDGGTLTVQGIGVSAVIAIAAVAIATAVAFTRHDASQAQP
ncbi:MAG: hypothetical protein Q7S35_01375 [Candidatus Limnocylindrales bacterium]|nr:hypothetical protein [Candidatus Limnocylindrales bacterium]